MTKMNKKAVNKNQEVDVKTKTTFTCDTKSQQSISIPVSTNTVPNSPPKSKVEAQAQITALISRHKNSLRALAKL